ncbi:MAG: hypothetical protein M5U01_06540 [Ardenticatenaceae bacterium]|nr:hypothetical protein [Ardenticatenaceae bacterium]
MAFDWSEYARLAQELAGDPPEPAAGQEARARSALSRAYYAAFCEARNLLKKRKLYTDPGRDDEEHRNEHRYVHRKFEQHQNFNYQKVADNLKRLRIDRNIADYDDRPIRQLERTVARNIELAWRTLQLLSRL